MRNARKRVQIENPVHSLAHDPHPQRVQCICLAAPRPESVAEAQKVLLPDLVENRSHRVLDDFVLQRRDPQWSLPPIGFWYPDSARRLRMIRPAMDSPMQVAQARLQVLSILLPRHPIHSRRRLFLQTVVALPEQVDAYVVQQGCELPLPVLRCFAHTRQPAWPALPARCPARVRLLRVLLGQRPSLNSLRRRSPAFVRLFRRYYAAVRLPAAVHEGLIAHRVLPPARATLLAGGHGVSRFSRMEFLRMLGVFDSAGPRRTRAGVRRVVAFLAT